MELLIELLFELFVGGSIEAVNDDEIPRLIRIGLLIFVSLVYLIFILLLLWILFNTQSIFIKVLMFGIIVFLIFSFVKLWKKVLNCRG